MRFEDHFVVLWQKIVPCADRIVLSYVKRKAVFRKVGIVDEHRGKDFQMVGFFKPQG